MCFWGSVPAGVGQIRAVDKGLDSVVEPSYVENPADAVVCVVCRLMSVPTWCGPEKRW